MSDPTTRLGVDRTEISQWALDRAAACMNEARGGPIVAVAPERTERLVAAAIEDGMVEGRLEALARITELEAALVVLAREKAELEQDATKHHDLIDSLYTLLEPYWPWGVKLPSVVRNLLSEIAAHPDAPKGTFEPAEFWIAAHEEDSNEDAAKALRAREAEMFASLHERIDELEKAYESNTVWRDMAKAISEAMTGKRRADADLAECIRYREQTFAEMQKVIDNQTRCTPAERALIEAAVAMGGVSSVGEQPWEEQVVDPEERSFNAAREAVIAERAGGKA